MAQDENRLDLPADQLENSEQQPNDQGQGISTADLQQASPENQGMTGDPFVEQMQVNQDPVLMEENPFNTEDRGYNVDRTITEDPAFTEERPDMAEDPAFTQEERFTLDTDQNPEDPSLYANADAPFINEEFGEDRAIPREDRRIEDVPFADDADEELAAEVAPEYRENGVINATNTANATDTDTPATPADTTNTQINRGQNGGIQGGFTQQIGGATRQVEDAVVNRFGGRRLGYAALILSLASLFIFPVLTASLGAITGFFAFRNGARTLGLWAIAIGAFSLIMGLFFTPFVR